MNFGDSASLGNRGSSDGMVEILVLVVPLDTSVVVSIVLKGLVDRSEVLQAAHGSNKYVRRFENCGVVEADSERVPALFDFRVGITSAVVIRVDIFHDRDVDILLIQEQLVLENYLKVGVVVIVFKVVSGSSGTIYSDEAISDTNSINGQLSSEVKGLRRKSRIIHPFRPVHFGEELIHLPLGVIVLHPVFPGLSQLDGSDTLLEVGVDVVLEELLHHFFTELGLHVP